MYIKFLLEFIRIYFKDLLNDPCNEYIPVILLVL